MSVHFPRLMGNDIKVPVYDGTILPYLNLDNSATTPPFEQVFNKVKEILPLYGSVHRGCGYKSIYSTTVYEEAIDIILDFADSDKSNDILIFGVNATDCINHLARRIDFKENEFVIVSESEHTSNVLPWQKMAEVLSCKCDDNDVFDLNHLEFLLKTNNVRIVSVTGASNISGKITNLDPIAILTHKYGAEICVDGSQLAGHRKIKRGNIESSTHIDYFVFSAHKMYAPFGVGALVGNKQIFEKGWPDMVGGGTVKWLDSNDIIWSETTKRENGGTPNYVGAVALAEACKVIESIGYDKILLHESKLINQAHNSFKDIPALRLVEDIEINLEKQIPIFSFHINDYSHSIVGAFLGFEKAIGVRTGILCQFHYLQKFFPKSEEYFEQIKNNLNAGINTSNDFGLTRASCGLGNTPNDIVRLADSIKELIDSGTKVKYKIDTNGLYIPT
ncbi:MAG: aminotransferase class V-fold PLP-dependent enzyme [Paludibacter sp.]